MFRCLFHQMDLERGEQKKKQELNYSQQTLYPLQTLLMKTKGNKLEFISQINRDGSGTSKIEDESLAMMKDEYFRIKVLSISQKTYIAFHFNAFVVRFKP